MRKTEKNRHSECTARIRMTPFRAVRRRGLPDNPDRGRPIPALRHLPDMRESPPPDAADVGNLDHRARMCFGVKTGQAPFLPADRALMAHPVARLEAPVVPGPLGHVLQPLMTGLHSLLVNGGGLVARLDRPGLQVPGTGQRNARSRVPVPAPLAQPVCPDVLVIESGPAPITLIQ